MSPTPDVPVPTPRRRSRRLPLVGLLVVVLLAGAATAAGLLILRKPSVADPRALALAELSASATPTETPFTGDLRSLLLAPPAGSSPWDKPFSPDGNLTLAQVADWFGTTTDALNHDTEITAAAIQQWVTADDVQVSIVLLSFPRPQTAHQWAAVRRDVSYRGDYTDDSPVPGFPESGLFYTKQPTDGLSGVRAYVAKNDIAMNANMWSPPPVNHDAVTALLERQLARRP